MQLPVVQHEPTGALSHRPSERDHPARLVGWAVQRFAAQRIVVTTQFGMEGCALIDMIAAAAAPLTITYLDTHFLFPETYALRDELARAYPLLRFVNRGTDLTPEAQAETFAPELWKTNPDLCCAIRKVEPMRRILAEADVWITAIRRDQSSQRAQARVVEWDWRFDVLKISPLAHWSRAEVWDYIRAHRVPYNPLHEREYPSIGCTHCTRPVPGASVTDYSRDGRWRGAGKTECGLHLGENI